MQIQLQRLVRDQVDGNRIGAEGVQHEHVERGVRLRRKHQPRITRNHSHDDLEHSHAGFVRDLVHDFLDCHPCAIGIVAVLGEGGHIPVDLGGRAGRARADRHDRQRDTVMHGLAHRPAKGAAGMVRAVHPDEDSGHFCSSDS